MTVPDLEKLIPTIMASVETAENTNIGMDTNVFQDVQTCIMNSLRQRKALEVHHLDIYAWSDVKEMDGDTAKGDVHRKKACRIGTFPLLTIINLPEIMTHVKAAEGTNIGMVTDAFQDLEKTIINLPEIMAHVKAAEGTNIGMVTN